MYTFNETKSMLQMEDMIGRNVITLFKKETDHNSIVIINLKDIGEIHFSYSSFKKKN